MARKSSAKNEMDELEKSYRKVAGKYAKTGAPAKNGGTITTVSIISAIVILIFTLTACSFLLFGGSKNTITVNLSIAGVQVKDMSKQEAIKAVSAAVSENYSTKTMVITIDGQSIELSPELTGITLDVEKAVEDACAMTATETGIMDLKPYFNLNKEAVLNALKPSVENKNSTLVHSTYSVEGTAPTKFNPDDTTVYQTMKIQVGYPGINLDIEVLYNAVLDTYGKNQFSMEYEFTEIEPNLPDLQKAFEENCTAAVDGNVDLENKTVTTDQLGYGFNIDDVTEQIKNAEYGENLTINFTCLQPSKTKQQAIDEVFPDTLSSYTAKSGSVPGGRDVNLKLACGKLNEYILMPGDVFDYNPTLGERTPEAGWKQADGYIGYETVPQYGGGICQPSSCLYYCALLADLEIVERYNHVFISSYMPYGMDATVSWGAPDFKFKNNMDHPVIILAEANGGNTAFTLKGTDNRDYYIKMEYAILAVESYETEYVEFTEEDNPKGYEDGDVICTPYTGYTIETYRCKYSKADNTLISRKVEAYNHYSKRNYMIAKLVTEEVPEDTTGENVDPTVPDNTEDGGITEDTGGSTDNTDPPVVLPGSGNNIGEA